MGVGRRVGVAATLLEFWKKSKKYFYFFKRIKEKRENEGKRRETETEEGHAWYNYYKFNRRVGEFLSLLLLCVLMFFESCTALTLSVPIAQLSF